MSGGVFLVHPADMFVQSMEKHVGVKWKCCSCMQTSVKVFSCSANLINLKEKENEELSFHARSIVVALCIFL